MTLITRKEAEKVVRGILQAEYGNKEFAPNLFKDSVDQLMKEYNGDEEEIENDD